MVEKAVAEEVGGLKSLTPTSTCVLIEGVLAETPEGTKQKVGACQLLGSVWAEAAGLETAVCAGVHVGCLPAREGESGG